MIALDCQKTTLQHPLGWDMTHGMVSELVTGVVARWAMRFTALTPAPPVALTAWHRQQRHAWTGWLNGLHAMPTAMQQSIQLRVWRTSMGMHMALVGMTAGDAADEVIAAAHHHADWAWHMLPPAYAVQPMLTATDLQAVLNDDWLGTLAQNAVWRVQRAEQWHDDHYALDPALHPAQGFMHSVRAIYHTPSPMMLTLTAQPTVLEPAERADVLQLARHAPAFQRLVTSQRLWQTAVMVCADATQLVLPAIQTDYLRDSTTPNPVVEQPLADERAAAMAAVQWGQVLPWGMTIAPPRATRFRGMVASETLAASFCPPPLTADLLAVLRLPVPYTAVELRDEG